MIIDCVCVNFRIWYVLQCVVGNGNMVIRWRVNNVICIIQENRSFTRCCFKGFLWLFYFILHAVHLLLCCLAGLSCFELGVLCLFHDSERDGLVNASQCRLCDPGYFCSQTGLSAVSGPCLPGTLGRLPVTLHYQSLH